MDATKNPTAFLHAMTNDFASAMRAGRGERVNRALETIEDMPFRA
jgi:hypothetical protein